MGTVFLLFMHILRRTADGYPFKSLNQVFKLFARVAMGALLVAVFLSSCDSGPGADSDVPGIPVLTSPLNASADQPNALYLEWDASPGAASYHVQVSGKSNFTALVLDKTAVITTIIPVDELHMDSTYFWRVRARGDAGVSDWSAPWTFTPSKLAALPSHPDLAFPPNGAEDQGASITFVWRRTEGARFYHIQASLEQDFFSREADMIVETDTSQSVSKLILDYTYFWRVRGQNAAGFGPWSPTWFVVIANLN